MNFLSYLKKDVHSSTIIEGFQAAAEKTLEIYSQIAQKIQPDDRVLLKKCYDIDAEFGCVVYISNKIEKEKRDMPIAMSFKLKPIEETLTDMIEKSRIIKRSLTDCTLPERTKCFLCDGMCSYASFCFEDDRKKWKE